MSNKLIKTLHLVILGILLVSMATYAQVSHQASPLVSHQAFHQPSPQESKSTPTNIHKSELQQSHIVSHGSSDHFADQVRQALPKAKKELFSKLGLAMPAITIYLSPNKTEMRTLAEQKHRFTPPSWSAGLAYPRSQEIYLPEVPHSQLSPLLKHELVHIALGQYKKIPLWVNEGIAVAVGEGLSWERLWTLHESATQESLLKFESLQKHFPHSGTQASIAYAQSAHFIAHLRETQGDPQFKAWLSALLAGEAIDKASATHLSHEFWFLERTWRKSLEKGWLAQIALFFKMETIWALCILFFVFAGLKKLRLRRQRLLSYPDEQPLTVHIAHSIHQQPKAHEVSNISQSKSERIFR